MCNFTITNTSKVLSCVCGDGGGTHKKRRHCAMNLLSSLGVWQHGEAPCKNCPRVNFYQEARELEGEELTLKSGSVGSLGGTVQVGLACAGVI